MTARLNPPAICALPGAYQCLRAGLRSTAHPANARKRSQLEGVLPEDELALLFDPQTSGGLLISVVPERAAPLVDQLQRAGYREAAIIGAFEAASSDEALPISLRRDSRGKHRA